MFNLLKKQGPSISQGVIDINGFRKGTREWYLQAYKGMTFDRGYENKIIFGAQRVLRGKQSYVQVEEKTGVPWYVIGGIHSMESSCNFKGVLHNGERIIGTGLKTRLVPKGRGPFKTWEEAAIDAVFYDGLDNVKRWDIGNMLKQVEAYNGLGYLKYHPSENSPYLWAMTSVNDGFGKYVADGKWSNKADANAQVGFAAILKQLEIWREIKLEA